MQPTTSITLRLHALSLAIAALLTSAPTASADGLDRRIGIRFDEPTTLTSLCRELGRATGLTFVLDEGVRTDTLVTLDLEGQTVARALDVMELTEGLFREEVDEGVFVIAPDNQTKRREYEQQAVRTFFLEHAGVKEINALLRGVVDIRKTAVDERTNSITIRDSREKVGIAGDLIGRLDRPSGEAGIDVRLVAIEPRRETAATASGRRDRPGRDRPDDGMRLSQAALDRLLRSSQVLAGPRLSVRDGGRARLDISDPAPGDGIALSLALEADVKPDGVVGLDVQLEIESPSPLADGAGPRRQLSSSIQLKPGESCLFSGLSRLRRTSDGHRIASLLGDPDSEDLELAVILSPRVTRRVEATDENDTAMLVGTERRPVHRGR